MSWKSIANTVGKIAPTLGSLLGGKAGEVVGSLIATTLGVENTPDAVSEALRINPEIAYKLAELESTERVKLRELLLEQAKAELAADTQVISDVNKTMQTEAASEHWPTYAWRPFIGFSFGMYINSMWVLPLMHITPVTLSADLTLAIGGILGIASYFRGKAQADPNIQTSNKG